MDFKSLKVYQKAFSLAMRIFEESKSFPSEEKFSLTDQIRRSSRSVCANIAEAYMERKYPKHFVSKLTDCDAENAETQTWIEFAYSCDYLSEETKISLTEDSYEIGRLLNFMIQNPGKFGAGD
ncbi:four helix bundle protein [Zunongwangia sp. HRR-M8]|uniref:four helix bundle protein n=1 Tax=Zunongwangia sp. HRR-M8 TaxID=3015170 RepID=UPI0022DD5BDB|nr:four helix bundle protein [Zunongwangia sp. HRR-M8]WBL21827.1 four helix bundle protein [Zunongwangia sp. HRR-M8]